MNVIMLLKPKKEVSFLTESQNLLQGLKKMRRYGYAAIPVLSDDGSYFGSVSLGDCLWHIIDKTDSINSKCLENSYVRDIVRREWNPAVHIDVEMPMLLERTMNQNFVPVVDDREFFIGIVTRRDVIKSFLQE